MVGRERVRAHSHVGEVVACRVLLLYPVDRTDQIMICPTWTVQLSGWGRTASIAPQCGIIAIEIG